MMQHSKTLSSSPSATARTLSPPPSFAIKTHPEPPASSASNLPETFRLFSRDENGAASVTPDSLERIFTKSSASSQQRTGAGSHISINSAVRQQFVRERTFTSATPPPLHVVNPPPQGGGGGGEMNKNTHDFCVGVDFLSNPLSGGQDNSGGQAAMVQPQPPLNNHTYPISLSHATQTSYSVPPFTVITEIPKSKLVHTQSQTQFMHTQSTQVSLGDVELQQPVPPAPAPAPAPDTAAPVGVMDYPMELLDQAVQLKVYLQDEDGITVGPLKYTSQGIQAGSKGSPHFGSIQFLAISQGESTFREGLVSELNSLLLNLADGKSLKVLLNPPKVHAEALHASSRSQMSSVSEFPPAAEKAFQSFYSILEDRMKKLESENNALKKLLMTDAATDVMTTRLPQSSETLPTQIEEKSSKEPTAQKPSEPVRRNSLVQPQQPSPVQPEERETGDDNNSTHVDSSLYEMLQEFMVENEALRLENAKLLQGRDVVELQQKKLSAENMELVHRLDAIERQILSQHQQRMKEDYYEAERERSGGSNRQVVVPPSFLHESLSMPQEFIDPHYIGISYMRSHPPPSAQAPPPPPPPQQQPSQVPPLIPPQSQPSYNTNNQLLPSEMKSKAANMETQSYVPQRLPPISHSNSADSLNPSFAKQNWRVNPVDPFPMYPMNSPHSAAGSQPGGHQHGVKYAQSASHTHTDKYNNGGPPSNAWVMMDNVPSEPPQRLQLQHEGYSPLVGGGGGGGREGGSGGGGRNIKTKFARVDRHGNVVTDVVKTQSDDHNWNLRQELSLMEGSISQKERIASYNKQLQRNSLKKRWLL